MKERRRLEKLAVAEAVKAFEERILLSQGYNAPEMLDAFRYFCWASLVLALPIPQC